MNKRLAVLIGLAVMLFSSAGIATFLSAQEAPRVGIRQAVNFDADLPVVAKGAAPAEPAPAAPQEDPKGVAPQEEPARETPPEEPAREAPPVEAALPPRTEKGLALEVLYAPDLIYRTSSNAVWRVSNKDGILLSADGARTWTQRNQGLPFRLVYPFDTVLPPAVEGFSVDPLDSGHVGIVTADTLFLSASAGEGWQKIELKEPFKPNDQAVSLSISPLDPKSILVGTSFHGFFETRDGGKSWTQFSDFLRSLSFGDGTYQEISSIAYHPTDPDLICLDLGFGKGLYWFRRTTKTLEPIEFPATQSHARIMDVAFRRPLETGAWVLEVRTTDERWQLALDTGRWDIVEKTGSYDERTPEKAARLARASGRFGIYVSSYWASGKLLDRHLAFLKKNGLNSMVVDCKDDFGIVTYDTSLALPRKIGAVQKRFSIDDLVAAAHANGIYLIARIVVFRDKQLYNSSDYAYAAWDRISQAPWRYVRKVVDEATGVESLVQTEHWVDPYSEYVWDYNIAIARELQDRGVDEIQFDYIRFPSDGDISRITYRYRKQGMGKLEALESFLAKTREAIQIPISTDVYGYCGWARISNWVAQNVEMYSRYVDVISPMFYPSHFPREFLGSMAYVDRASYIYEEGTRRSAWMVEGRSIIRPYVQAFRLGGELAFSPATYSRYLVAQVQGTLKGAGSGFTMWNASNDYYMVTSPLGPLLASAAAERTK